MEKQTRVTVFEAINRVRGELFIGATPRPMHVLIAELRHSPPPETASWLPDEVEYRSLAFDLEREEAKDYIRRYAAARSGWKVYTAGEVIDR